MKLSKIGLTLIGVYLLVVFLCLRYYVDCKEYYAELYIPYLFCDFPLKLAVPLIFGFAIVNSGLPNDVSSFWQLYLGFLLLHVLLVYYLGSKLESLLIQRSH
jgi:hypothetical protein